MRPLNPKEAALGGTLCVDFPDKKTIAIKTAQDFGPHKFTFDRVFDMRSTQEEVYDISAKPVVESNILFSDIYFSFITSFHPIF